MRFSFPKFVLSAFVFVAGTVVSIFSSAQELPTASPEEHGMSSEKLKDLEAAMQGLVDDGNVAGIITSIMRDGKVIHFETYGQMDMEKDKPMQEDALFRMYSMTKVITGVAVMTLYEEGKFQLDDPIAKYLPEFENMEVYVSDTERVPANRPITVKHLLTHTSGITYDFYGGTPVSDMMTEKGLTIQGAYDKDQSLEDFVKDLAKYPLVNHPGEKWHYSLSIDVLGRLVEVWSGENFGEYLEARVFGPLKMVDAGFHVKDKDLDRFSANYFKTPGSDLTLIDPPETSLYRKVSPLQFGGAGLVSSARDYLRFAQMLVNGGELEGVRILKPETVALMTSNQLDLGELGAAPLGGFLGIFGMAGKGLSFGLTGSVITDNEALGGNGSTGEFTWGGAASTDFWIDPQEKLVAMVLTQLMPSGSQPTRTYLHKYTYDAMTKRYAK